MGLILIPMELSMLDNGRTISKMDKECNSGWTDKNMKDSIEMERRTGKEF